MSDWGILLLFYAIGVIMLVAEIFIPSHGILSVAGVGFLVAGIVKTFGTAGREAGIVAVFACLVFVPAFAFLAIKYWHKTPVGRRIAPPNPVITAADVGVPVEDLSRFVGHVGRAKTALRPVGICEFEGKRISCVAEYGLIDPGAEVEATRVVGGNLGVQERRGTA